MRILQKIFDATAAVHDALDDKRETDMHRDDIGKLSFASLRVIGVCLAEEPLVYACKGAVLAAKKTGRPIDGSRMGL